MNVDKQIMSLFYRSIVESVMSYCIISWFGSSHKKDQHKLAKIGRIAKIMGVNSKNLNELYQNDFINMVDKILNCLTAAAKMDALQNCELKFSGRAMQNLCRNQTCSQRLLSPSLWSLTSSKSS